ncbi:hypothetical protein BH09PSE5_BH09PSE5_04400 [soil metagenome]
MSSSAAISFARMQAAPERAITTGNNAPSERNTIDRLLDTVRRTQAGELDGSASTLALLDELKKSSDPALKAVGSKIDLLDRRLGGSFEDKIPALLKNMGTMLEIEGGDANRNKPSSGNVVANDGGGAGLIGFPGFGFQGLPAPGIGY